jgi:hypothetical protein
MKSSLQHSLLRDHLKGEQSFGLSGLHDELGVTEYNTAFTVKN